MLSRAKHKVQSQRGASLSMALMLFLVITTVASIVLAAATASAGRIAQAEQLEKSYYTITSAMDLVRSEIKDPSTNRSVKITRMYDPENKSWAMTLGTMDVVASDAMKSPTCTLFQLATLDLVLASASESITDSSPSSFKDLRSVSSDTIKSSMVNADTLGSAADQAAAAANVTPKDIPWTPHTYEHFEISGPSGYSNLFDPVRVTVYRNTDETFSLVFEQDGASTAVFTLVASVGFATPEPSEGTTTWNTTVTWTPMYVVEGSHHD